MSEQLLWRVPRGSGLGYVVEEVATIYGLEPVAPEAILIEDFDKAVERMAQRGMGLPHSALRELLHAAAGL